MSPIRASAFRVRPLHAVPAAGLLALLALLARLQAVPIGNPDTWFHLRFGQEFASGAWQLGNPRSASTFGTRDWVRRNGSARS